MMSDEMYRLHDRDMPDCPNVTSHRFIVGPIGFLCGDCGWYIDLTEDVIQVSRYTREEVEHLYFVPEPPHTQVETPNWDTKLRCSCGFEAATKQELDQHRTQALYEYNVQIADDFNSDG